MIKTAYEVAVGDDEVARNAGEVDTKNVVGVVRKEWEVRKLENAKLVELYEKAREIDFSVITPQRLDDLKSCGSYLRFGHYSDDSGRVRCKLDRASFCRVRLCPICQWRRGLKLFGQMKELMPVMISRYPKCRYLFVTLTVKNCEMSALGTTLDLLNKAFVKLTKIERLNLVLRGYVRALEITINKNFLTAHPHLHVLLAVDADYFMGSGYIRQSKWRELWQSALGVDYLPMVNVQAVKQSEHTLSEICGAFRYASDGTKGAAGDVKRIFEMYEGGIGEDVPLEMLIALTHTLRKRRFISFGGVFKNIRRELGQTDSEDLSDAKEIKTAEMAGLVQGHTRFKFDFKNGVYVAL